MPVGDEVMFAANGPEKPGGSAQQLVIEELLDRCGRERKLVDARHGLFPHVRLHVLFTGVECTMYAVDQVSSAKCLRPLSHRPENLQASYPHLGARRCFGAFVKFAGAAAFTSPFL